MNDPDHNKGIEWNWQADPLIHRFAHHAMATTYELYIRHGDKQYAEGAAHEAFKMLDRLEEELSRFIENSDISRINGLKAYESTRVGLPAFECLEMSKRLHDQTGGAFDITIGPLYTSWLTPEKSIREPTEQELTTARYRTGMHLIKLDASDYTVRVLRDKMRLDLGGVGKGYAVDSMADLLREWGVDVALIHGGKSSVFAMDPPERSPGWPITLSTMHQGRQQLARIQLDSMALSGSGLQKGQHILDPRKGEPVAGKLGAWVFSPGAAESDALSTAFMIMDPEEVEAYCNRHPEVRALLVLSTSPGTGEEIRVLTYGEWDSDELVVKND